MENKDSLNKHKNLDEFILSIEQLKYSLLDSNVSLSIDENINAHLKEVLPHIGTLNKSLSDSYWENLEGKREGADKLLSRMKWTYFISTLLVIGTFEWIAPQAFDLDSYFFWLLLTMCLIIFLGFGKWKKWFIRWQIKQCCKNTIEITKSIDDDYVLIANQLAKKAENFINKEYIDWEMPKLRIFRTKEFSFSPHLLHDIDRKTCFLFLPVNVLQPSLISSSDFEAIIAHELAHIVHEDSNISYNYYAANILTWANIPNLIQVGFVISALIMVSILKVRIPEEYLLPSCFAGGVFWTLVLQYISYRLNKRNFQDKYNSIRTRCRFIFYYTYSKHEYSKGT